MESVSVLNALVYQHLLKVAPNLTDEFKEKFQPISSSFNCHTLEEMVLKLLANSAVHSQLLVIAPNLAKEFQEKHLVIQNCDIFSKKLYEQETYTMDRQKQVVIQPKSKSCEAGSKVSVLKDTFSVNEFKKNGLVNDNLLAHSAIYNQLLLSAPNLAREFQEKHHSIYSRDISIKKLMTQFYKQKTLKQKEQLVCRPVHGVSLSKDDFTFTESKKNGTVITTDDSNTKSSNHFSSNQNFIQNLVHNPTNICAGNDAHELCFLSESSTYQDLRNNLKENSVVDKVVLHILNENIKISKINLQHVILANGQVQRQHHLGIEIGRFSPKDSSIINSNWNKLVTDMCMSNPENVLQIFCKRSSKLAKLKANVLGLYLSQGMEKLRLAADVFHHAERKLINCVSGKISPTEHEFIMDYMSKNCDSPNAFQDIAKALNRLYPQVIRSHFLKQNKDIFKKGIYSSEENKFCIGEIMKRSNIRTVLDIKNVNGKEGTVKKETFKEIAKQLGRPVRNISQHWEQILKPTLLHFHAGTLTLDVRRILANHLLDKNIVYMQDVPWAELVQNPQFAGHTKYSLNCVLNKLFTSTSRANNCKREEVTIQQIADLANNRYSDHSVKTGDKAMAQKLELVAYYKSVVNNDSNGVEK